MPSCLCNLPGYLRQAGRASPPCCCNSCPSLFTIVCPPLPQVNYLGPYALTRELEETLQRSAPARVRWACASVHFHAIRPALSLVNFRMPTRLCRSPCPVADPLRRLPCPVADPLRRLPCPVADPLRRLPCPAACRPQVVNVSSVTHRYGWIGDPTTFLSSWRPGSYYPR